MYLIPLVSGLTSNTTVKTLHLSFRSISLDESLAVGSFLEATPTIELFKLRLPGYGIEANVFRPIAQGLIQSTSVTDVRFDDCSFDGQEQVLILNSILASKTNLQSLTLELCSVFEDGREEFRAAILSLLQPHFSLQSFELLSDNLSTYGFDNSQDFGRLLTAVESSSLERFAIGTINSRESCLALIVSIPKMHVRTLELRIHRDLRDLKEGIMGAIKRNASLGTVVAKLGANNHVLDLLDHNDKMQLLAYSSRNIFLSQWIENPSALSKAAWAETLAAVFQTTGPSTVYEILVSLAPTLGPFMGSRRRRRLPSS
jgi:hypothetical protein